MEKNTDKKNEKSKILLVILFGLTLLTAIIGTTFAYYSATISGNEKSSSVIIKSAKLAIEFNGGNQIFEELVSPGWSATKTFTVSNTGESPILYSLSWADVYNDFVSKSQLEYNIAGSGTGATNVLTTTSPSISGTIKSNILINPGVTHTYNMIIKFVNYDSVSQNENQGKTFIGKIVVTDVKQP